ncbi:hypothetical protein J3R83DRAFT_10990 [Lanmaoa asiatica]|nr:hypothetical protein J3R83DRAFT_10990 [Lanmaoa asiatica]
MRYSTRLSLALTFLSWVAVVRSQNCQLQVPANPLTAQGLATPYVLTGCNQLDFANQGVFVEAAILDPATGNIQIYSPLVINVGMTPVGNGTGAATTNASATTSVGAATGISTPSGSTNAGTTTVPTIGASGVASSTITSAEATATKAARQAASAGFYVPPIVPTLPNNAIVGIWFGSNAVSVTLTGSTGGCVNGQGNSVFGQFAYCNGQAWFNAAKTAVSQGLINLPAPGTGSGGQACPTTHDFRDQSDNVVTTYLLIGGNTLAQNTPANNKANPNAQVLSNASDNALITQFIDPALGCAPYQSPCTTCLTGQSSALATDELVANFFPPAGVPALVPLNDPMVLVNEQQSLQKVNLYRDGTGQPQADNNNASALTYCQQFTQSGIFINNNQQLFTNAGSPAANVANNLFNFLAMRFSTAFGPAPGVCSPLVHVFPASLIQSVGLGCTGLLNVANPVTLTMDGNGVVTAATINTQSLQQILAGVAGGATTAASTSSVSAPASTPASSVSTGTTTAASVTALATISSSTGTMSHPSVSVLASTSSASVAGTSAASQTGVLLHLTSITSSVPSAAPTSAAGNTTSSAVATSVASGPQTSVAGSTMQVPTSSSTPACTNTATVTVTVTATVCPTQASPTAWWNDGWNGERNYGGHRWKRSTPFAADRMHRKSRIASSD